MDKSTLELLQDAQKEINALKERIAALESRISDIQQNAAQNPEEAAEVDFTGIELGVETEPEVAEVPVAPAEEPVAEPIPFAEPEEPVPADPIFAPEPAPETPAVPEAPSAPTPAVDTSNLPWRKDKPGIMVKNIRSGISLLDRAQFIGTLFKEDFTLYDNTIAALNEMETLDQAVEYIQQNFPQWNMNSDVVYRFMMAVRKKLG